MPINVRIFLTTAPFELQTLQLLIALFFFQPHNTFHIEFADVNYNT